jgi:hypothetical protein
MSKEQKHGDPSRGPEQDITKPESMSPSPEPAETDYPEPRNVEPSGKPQNADYTRQDQPRFGEEALPQAHKDQDRNIKPGGTPDVEEEKKKKRRDAA